MLRFLSLVCAGQLLVLFVGPAPAQETRDEILALLAKIDGKAKMDETLPGCPIVEVDI